MTRASPMQTNFTAGEWSPLIEGHVNLAAFPNSGLLVQNLIPLKQGPLVRRGGTRFVKEVKDSADDTVIIPFEFSTTQAYLIEAGDSYFRFYRNNGVITEAAQNITNITKTNPAVVTYDGADNYANGDEVYISGVVGMTEVNGKFFLVSNVDTGANTFELEDIDGVDVDSSAYSEYTSGGTVAEVYEIASPFAKTDLFDSDGVHNFQTAQSADVLYITHTDYQTRSLTRTAHTSWSVNTMDLIDGPYLDENTSDTTLTLSGTSGSVTVTASATTGINGGDGFKSTDVGRNIRWHDGTNFTWLEITVVGGTTSVTATIRGENAAVTTATVRWRLGAFSDTTGWPRVITFFQNRVFLAGPDSFPDFWALTRTGGYSDTEYQFAPDTDGDGTPTDDAGITGTLQSGKVNAIQWADADEKGLLVGTSSQEWLITPSTANEVLTPDNVSANPVSSIGGSYIQPIPAESGSLFMQRSRRRAHDVVYSFEQDQLKPRDITLLSEHITRNQITNMQFQKEPVNVVWMTRGDGLLVGITYYPDQEVFAWHRHPLGGTNVSVKDIAVIPSSDGSRDELWLLVERTINGTTRKYIEYMTRFYEEDIDKEDAIHIDSALIYDSTATTSVTGLDHLEGETVKVMVDGMSHPDLTVSGGSVTLENDVSGSTINIGLGNTWAFKGQKIEAGAQDGVAQGKIKRIAGIVVRVLNTLGLNYGPDTTVYDEYDFNQGSEYDESLSLYTGDTDYLRWPGGYDTSGHIYLWHDGVFPAAILATMPNITTYDRG